MQRIYEPADLLEAELLQGMLASEGIEAHLAGRHLLGAVGELPVSGLLGLLVEDSDAERARQLIAAYNAALPLPGEEPEHVPGVLLC
ncbi:putative signal transducing protein [Pseudomonas indica]|uniref:putative signal transducing protein n=1 Tax=Pseudomonas indica TaxID=137658 RepID=UPI003FD50B7F